MSKFSILAATAAITFMVGTAHAAPKSYPTEDAATKACKSAVVWGNPDSGVYHLKGSRDYGRTKSGEWVCEAAAKKAGWHAAKNNQ